MKLKYDTDRAFDVLQDRLVINRALDMVHEESPSRSIALHRHTSI